jgi:hypothetical protein
MVTVPLHLLLDFNLSGLHRMMFLLGSRLDKLSGSRVHFNFNVLSVQDFQPGGVALLVTGRHNFLVSLLTPGYQEHGARVCISSSACLLVIPPQLVRLWL